MEQITSRKNELIRRIRRLSSEKAARYEAGLFVCDGKKLLMEALGHSAEITSALWSCTPFVALPHAAQYLVPPDLLDYVSPLKHAADVVFTVRIPYWEFSSPGRTLVLETIQDPGNLGTILRTANALNMDTVILTGDCADPFSPKSVRATMGAVFRQRLYQMERGEARQFLLSHGIRLCGAALSDRAADLRSVELRNTAVVIGSEGQGLSDQMLSLCDGEVMIPMNPNCESLNAAVAASIIMWELTK